MVRSFGVTINEKNCTRYLADKLDEKLLKLQNNYWEIISVFATPVIGHDVCKGYFDTTLFTIVAKKDYPKNASTYIRPEMIDKWSEKYLSMEERCISNLMSSQEAIDELTWAEIDELILWAEE